MDRRGGPISGQPNWSSGFMSAAYSGTLFRPSGDPILDLRGPLDRAAWAARRHPGESLVSTENSSKLTRRLRGLLGRMLWPELAAQRRLDADLAEALQALADELNRVSKRIDALEEVVANRSQLNE
jgi:hypothetical protein